MIYVDSLQPFECYYIFELDRPLTPGERQVLGAWCVYIACLVRRDGGAVWPVMSCTESRVTWYYRVQQYYSSERFWGVIERELELGDIMTRDEWYKRVRGSIPEHFGFELPESRERFVEIATPCAPALNHLLARSLSKVELSSKAAAQARQNDVSISKRT